MIVHMETPKQSNENYYNLVFQGFWIQGLYRKTTYFCTLVTKIECETYNDITYNSIKTYPMQRNKLYKRCATSLHRTLVCTERNERKSKSLKGSVVTDNETVIVIKI